MSATLVQSALGGNASAAFVAGTPATATATGNLPSATTPGNFLVLITSNTQTRTSGIGFNPATITPSTPGITWVHAFSVGPGDVGAVRSGTDLYFVSNAPSVSAATLTSVAYAVGSLGSANGNIGIELALYEFSGVSQSASVVFPGGPLIDQEATNTNQAGGNPSVSITTSAIDLIIAFFRGNSANAAAPAGYTLGQNMAVNTVAQMAFNGNVPVGAQTPTFTGAQTNWGEGAIALQLQTAPQLRRNYMDDLPIWCHSYTAPEGKDKFRGSSHAGNS